MWCGPPRLTGETGVSASSEVTGVVHCGETENDLLGFIFEMQCGEQGICSETDCSHQ
jgi:hypothetical protein